MAATMYRGRSLRRSKGRHDSGDTDVPLDLNKAPKDNIQEILSSLTRNSGLTKGKKLGHLNNFVKLINHVSSFDKLGYSVAEIICCLRLAVVHPAKEIRGAGVRALRHLVQDEVTVQAMLALHVDRLLMRSLDIYQRNDVERVQALRFIRRILAVAPAFCPISLVHVLVAVSNSDDKERDRMRNACVATLCELAVLNPGVFSHARGLGALVRNILDMQLLRINEAVMLTVLHLLNHPASRRFIRFKVDLEQVIAPFTDFNYRHTGDSSESQASEKDGLYQASRMAIVTLLRSWPGMIRLCRSDATGLQSLLAILCVHNDENRRYLLEVLYDIFYLPIPEWTEDFSMALQSIDSCQMKSSWTLSEGFVVAEALDLLPNRATTRPNLTENHLALLLLAFINAGLLESLVEVVTSDNANLSIQATILLGELLYMADKILPPECEQHHHCLPTLMTLAASFDVPLLQRNRASAAVTNLERHHEMKKRGVIPCSLYLDHILSNSDMFVTQKVVADKSKDTPVVSRSRSRSFSSALGMTSSWDKISNRSTQENEDSAVQTMIKETLVLTTKDYTVWNWELIGGAIKKGGVTLKKFEDANVNRFFRRLVEFYKPMSKQYSVISLGRELGRSSEIQSYTIIGCQLLNFLLNCDEADAEKLLMELAVDIGDCLLEISMAPRNELPPQAVFSPSSIQNTLSQDYFLLVGKLSKTHEGEKILEKAGVFQYLLDVCSMPHHETLQKLVVTCLDYKRDGLARTVLGKMLAGSSESMRIYATNHLRVLLRAQTPFFHTWGVELLITQLHDKARSISSLALDILDEACEDDANLHSLVHMRPPLLHMGDKGALLLTRFISTTKGFKYLHDVNYVSHELERWYTYFNRKYVTLIETEINEAFTCYHRPQVSGGFIRRSKDERRQRKDVYVPVHLYGQLAKHRGGCELIEKQNHIQEMCEVIRYGDVETMDTILNLKAALWALGHTGSTTWGLKLLQQEGIIPDIIRLAEECEVFSIRGTCFYVLGLISKTRQGADSLSSLGWESIRHSRGDYFPVMEDRENVPTVLPLEEYNHNHRDLSSPISLPSFSPYGMDSPKTPGDSSSTPKVDPGVKFFAGDPSPVQSPLTPGGPPNFLLEVTGETNSGGDAKTHPSTEERSTSPSPLARLSKRDRVGSATEQLPGINEVSDGGRTIIVDRASRTPLLRRAQTMPTIEGQDDDEPPPFDSVITKLRSNSDASSRMCKDKSSEGVRFNQDVHERSREQSRDRSHSLKRRCDSNESGNSSMGTKSRSESFATDTSQTSGVGSMHSNPSSPPVESSMSSVSTVSSSMTVKSIHSSDTLRKRHNLKRTPSFVRRISKTLSPNLSSYSNLFETSAAFTSVRDAHGYATLKALKLQHRQLSGGEDDSMIKRASSFGNPGEMRLRRGLSGMVESVSMSCLERASVITKAPSMKSLHQTSSTSSKTEYIGLCLPVDVTLIFHSDESQYKDGHSAPTSHAVSPAMTDIHIPQVQVYSPDSGSTANSNAPTQLESPTTNHPSEQHGITQPQTLSMGNADYSNLRIAEEDESGVREEEEEEEVHIDNNLHQIEHCLACTKVRTRSLESQEGDSILHPDDPASLVIFQPVDPPQPLLIRSRGNSSASASNPFGSSSVDNNTPTSVGSSGTSVSQSSQGTVRMRDDTPKGREMIRREVIRLVIKMSSSVGMKAHEEGLLGLREKFPKAFERTCLFSDVMNLLATSSYRLSSRRFIQELFQEVNFNEVHHEAERILGLEESSDTPSPSSGS